MTVIMDETRTIIKWPARLKSNVAKKKDPTVLIFGRTESIAVAQERIITTLDTTESRVILKMDVSYTDHSHIIGKEGTRIKQVMTETRCHIHFPDGNRNKQQEKSNQVSIAGEIQNVEMARQKIRTLMPLIFIFDVPIKGDPQLALNLTKDAYMLKIENDFKVQITLRNKSKLYSISVGVKGSECDLPQIKQATLAMMYYLHGQLPNPATVQMILDIAPQNQGFVQGLNNVNVHCLMQKTSTKIIFPGASDPNIPALMRSRVMIIGEIDDVYRAREGLLSLLPLVMMFDVSEHIMNQINSTELFKFTETHNLKITYRNKPRKNQLSVIIKGHEAVASKIYEARRKIVKDIFNFPTEPRSSKPVGIIGEEVVTARVPPGFTPISKAESTKESGLFLNKTLPSLIARIPTSLGCTSAGLRYPQWSSPVIPPQSNFFQPSGMNQSAKIMANTCKTLQESFFKEHSNSYNSSFYSNSTEVHNESKNSAPTVDSPIKEQNPGFECNLLSNLSSDGIYSLFPKDIEQKKIQGYRAMLSNVQPDQVRVPTSAWGGLGLSQTAPPGLEVDYSPWNNPVEVNPIGMNSNLFDHLSEAMINRIMSESIDDLPALLTIIGLEKYIRLFAMNEIDIYAFRQMTDQDLLSLGITAWGARRRILFLIAECNKRVACFRRTPGAERRKVNSTFNFGAADISKFQFKRH